MVAAGVDIPIAVGQLYFTNKGLEVEGALVTVPLFNAGVAGRRRSCHSAAPPSHSTRCCNMDGEGIPAEWQSRRRLGVAVFTITTSSNYFQSFSEPEPMPAGQVRPQEMAGCLLWPGSRSVLALLLRTRLYARRLWIGRFIFSRATESGTAFCECFVCTTKYTAKCRPSWQAAFLARKQCRAFSNKCRSGTRAVPSFLATDPVFSKTLPVPAFSSLAL